MCIRDRLLAGEEVAEDQAREDAELGWSSTWPVEDGNDVLVARQTQAQQTLDATGPVSLSAESHVALKLEPTLGDGWCFFRGVLRQLDLPQLSDLREVAFTALLAIVKRQADYFVFFAADEYTEERRASLQGITEYAAMLPRASNLDVYLLDMFEGLFVGDVSRERRYADIFLVKALLETLELTCLCIAWNDPARVLLLPQQEYVGLDDVYPPTDFVFVHYQDGAYLHYDATMPVGRTIWPMTEERKRQIRCVWGDLPFVHEVALLHLSLIHI